MCVDTSAKLKERPIPGVIWRVR